MYILSYTNSNSQENLSYSSNPYQSNMSIDHGKCHCGQTEWDVKLNERAISWYEPLVAIFGCLLTSKVSLRYLQIARTRVILSKPNHSQGELRDDQGRC